MAETTGHWPRATVSRWTEPNRPLTDSARWKTFYSFYCSFVADHLAENRGSLAREQSDCHGMCAAVQALKEDTLAPFTFRVHSVDVVRPCVRTKDRLCGDRTVTVNTQEIGLLIFHRDEFSFFVDLITFVVSCHTPTQLNLNDIL